MEIVLIAEGVLQDLLLLQGLVYRYTCNDSLPSFGRSKAVPKSYPWPPASPWTSLGGLWVSPLFPHQVLQFPSS